MVQKLITARETDGESGKVSPTLGYAESPNTHFETFGNDVYSTGESTVDGTDAQHDISLYRGLIFRCISLNVHHIKNIADYCYRF